MSPNDHHSAAGERPCGMVLHAGSSLALPAIPGIVSPGDDRAYLTQIQQWMQEFESLQQQAIAQMQEQFEQAQDLNAQYQEAISLSDELLLKEFQLKGIQFSRQTYWTGYLPIIRSSGELYYDWISCFRS